MFNTINNNTKINTPATGIIQKSNANSFFIRFHKNSTLSNDIFCSKPLYKNQNVIVLQVLLMSDDYVLCEVVYDKFL